jgi:ectoine hydroxylase
MASLSRLFQKYTGFLRSLKASYVINNVLNRNRLLHNKVLYPKYGLKKSIYSPIGSHDFSSPSPERPWLDTPNALERLEAHPRYNAFPADTQTEIRRFVDQGFAILKGFFSPEEVELLNQEVDRLLTSGTAEFNYTARKIMNAHEQSALIDTGYFRKKELVDILDFLLGRPVHPFQTINFIQGSEQRAHSDFVHMTTEPMGYLIAAWIALEKTDSGNGPLFYYPGSHRLPYATCQSYPSGNTRWRLGHNSYKKYEDHIEQVIQQQNLKKEYFYAEPGDVLIWHANLLHGGSPITETGRTRKSMVAHYYGQDVICYHEISQRPALL